MRIKDVETLNRALNPNLILHKVFICHWNLSSISAQNVLKASLSNKGNNLDIYDYNLFRVDHIYQILNKEVFVYITEILFPLKLHNLFRVDHIYQILNEEVFVYITDILFPLKLLGFDISKSALILTKKLN